MADFAKRLEAELKRRYDLCEDFSATPSSILLAVLNAVAEARKEPPAVSVAPEAAPEPSLKCPKCGGGWEKPKDVPRDSKSGYMNDAVYRHYMCSAEFHDGRRSGKDRRVNHVKSAVIEADAVGDRRTADRRKGANHTSVQEKE